MNNETLKIDLCARLPYGFMCKNDEDENKWVALIPMAIDEVSVKDAIVYEYKPYLFNSLTEPITINGETFIPIEEICEMRFPERNWKWEDHVSGCGFRIWIEDEEEDSEFWFWMEEWWDLPVWLIDLLNQWHINYRLSPDQFIAATNEYA